MGNLLKTIGGVLVVFSIAALIIGFCVLLGGGFEDATLSIIFLVGCISALIFSALIYAAGEVVEALHSIEKSVSYIHKKMKSEYYEEKYNRLTSDQNNTTSNYHANNVPDSDDDDLKYQSYKPGPIYKTQQNDK